jgi:Tol biopolymer transport system component
LHEILNIVVQTADALAAAHEVGIVHRDIKPENIMVRQRDSYVKVLDFGLAKRIDGAVDTHAPARVQAQTSAGMIMGTAAYMSPEQARGERVDVRTDIWSLGVVLYEMVAGRLPFEGSNTNEILASILSDKEPSPLARYAREVPSELERIVTKALTKDEEERYQTAKDLLTDLRRLRQRLVIDAERDRSASLEAVQPEKGPCSPRKTTRTTSSAEYLLGEIKSHKLGVLITLAVVVVTTTSVALWLVRLPQPLGTPEHIPLTRDTGLTMDPALSPDGKLLAYASDRSGNGNLDIWVRQVGGGEPIRLTQGPADEREPTFSPDGTLIAFTSDIGGGIYVISALGGVPPRKIVADGQRPRFSPDGSQIAYWSGAIGPGAGFSTRNFCRIFVVASAGGSPRQVRPDFVGAAYPEWTPDGTRLLFLGNRDEELRVDDDNLDWWVTPLDDGSPNATGALTATRREGLTGPFLVYPWALITAIWETRNNWLIFSARSGDNNNLWRIAISSETWKVTGSPQRLTSGSTIVESFSVASTGAGSVNIAYASLSENTDIWNLPLDANEGKVTGERRPLTRDLAADFHPSLSADGRKMVWVSASTGNQQIWIADWETGEKYALTASSVDKYSPRFSPDGLKVSFAAHINNKWDIYLVPAIGGPEEMICEDCGQATAWSPDGNYLIGNSRDGRLFLLEVTSRRRINLVAMSGRWFAGGAFSPDSRWITFLENGFPWRERIAPFQGETMAPESAWFSVLSELRAWSPDGSLVYGDSDHDGFKCLWAQRLDSTTKRPIGPPISILHEHGAGRSVFTSASISVARDRMVFTLAERTGNIWMAQWKGNW